MDIALPEIQQFSEQEQVDFLTEINVQDMSTSFGLEDLPFGKGVLHWFGRMPARRFSRQMLKYDNDIAAFGLQTASQTALNKYISTYQIIGQANIPKSGPLLILSNHPGMTDTLVLFASIPRNDLQIVAAERPFLQALPNVTSKLIFVKDDTSKRMTAVRKAVRHLKQGGALLTFPAGKIEPDPAVMPGAINAISNWSESIAIFVRMVRRLKIITAIVSGVLWPKATYHPLTKLHRKQEDQQRMGAALQALVQSSLPFFRPVNVHVVFGKPLTAADFDNPMDAKAILEGVTSQAKLLIQHSQQARTRTV